MNWSKISTFLTLIVVCSLQYTVFTVTAMPIASEDSLGHDANGDILYYDNEGNGYESDDQDEYYNIYNQGLFQGDLNISREQIEENYGNIFNNTDLFPGQWQSQHVSNYHYY